MLFPPATVTAISFTFALSVASAAALTITVDDSSIGYFIYGPTQDVWLTRRHDDPASARHYRGTDHFSVTKGAFVEFYTNAQTIQYIGLPPSKQSRIQIEIDGAVYTKSLLGTPGDSYVDEPQVLFTETLSGNKPLHLIRITNVDAPELHLDAVREIFQSSEGVRPSGESSASERDQTPRKSNILADEQARMSS
ncbi:5539_t:CDS:2 [Acaulospora colombiana]|uniref:5539_t:CDS:1 n=1 Tax=Acaulospora colombiana TaxID=27376 RepID=A0ACA9KG51_9GLOM|nr:5539_t:CDS:2 [Acaulospora colombiana]